LPNNDAAPEDEHASAAQDEQVDVDQADGGAEDGEAGGEGQQDGSALENDPNVKADSTQRTGDRSSAKQSDDAETSEDKENADASEADAREDEDDSAPPMATSADGTGPTKQRSQHDARAESKSDPSSQRDEGARPPQRSLGDSLQNWRRRLEEIGDLAQPEEPQEAPTQPVDQDGAAEYVQDGDEQEADEQALGPANEDQVKKLEQLHLGEETAPADEMPLDDESPAEPSDGTAPQPQASTVDLKGSTLTEADAKAVAASEMQRDDPMSLDALSADEDDVDVERADADKHGSTLAAPVDPEEDMAVEQAMLRWRSGDEQSLTADGVWRLYESLTRDLSFALTEQLRLILEPTLATRLKGDYRSGKRLNMKKIIPYIASEFTKDKIWLRRTRPSQREYQVLIAIDDSKSMADSHSVHLAFQSLALISRALTRLEVGGISVSRFGEDVDVLHPFEAGSVSDEAGAKLIEKFTFSQRSTDVRLLVERTLAQLAEAKDSARSGKSSLQAGDLWQLAVLISDGYVLVGSLLWMPDTLLTF
jgi:midasin